jgi:hypothetical protein
MRKSSVLERRSYCPRWAPDPAAPPACGSSFPGLPQAASRSCVSAIRPRCIYWSMNRLGIPAESSSTACSSTPGRNSSATLPEPDHSRAANREQIWKWRAVPNGAVKFDYLSAGVVWTTLARLRGIAKAAKSMAWSDSSTSALGDRASTRFGDGRRRIRCLTSYDYGPRSGAPKPVCGFALNRLGLNVRVIRVCPCELRITNEFPFGCVSRSTTCRRNVT